MGPRDNTQFKTLCDCILKNDIHLFTQHFRAFTDLNATDEKGNNLLHYALKQRPVNSEIITKLLDKGINPNSENDAGQNAIDLLSDATLSLEEAKKNILILLKKGADPFQEKHKNIFFNTKINIHDLMHNHLEEYIKNRLNNKIFVFIKNASISRIKWCINKAISEENILLLSNILNDYHNQPKLIETMNELRDPIMQLIEKNMVHLDANQTKESTWEFIYKLYKLGFDLPDTLKAIVEKHIAAIDKLIEYRNNYDTQELKEYLRKNPDININIILDNGQTLLTSAYMSRYSEQQFSGEAKNDIQASEDFFDFVLSISNINKKDGSGQTLLHIAFSRNDPLINIVELLLAGASNDILDDFGKKPIGYKEPDRSVSILESIFEIDFSSFDIEQVCNLLCQEEGLEAADNSAVKERINRVLTSSTQRYPLVQNCLTGNTLLHSYIQEHSTKNAILLIETYKQQIVNKENFKGETALTLAIRNKNASVVKALLENGVQITSSILKLTYESTSIAAVDCYDSNVVCVILDKLDELPQEIFDSVFKKACLNIDTDTIKQLCTKYPNRINFHLLTQYLLNYPEHTYEKNKALIDYLIDNRIPISHDSTELRDVIFYNAMNAKDRARAIQLLAYDPLLFIRFLDNVLNKKLPLSSVNVETIKNIMDSNHDEYHLLSENLDGESLLHIAIQSGCNIELIKLLLIHGADPNKKNKKGYSALHLAVNTEFTGAVFLLLQAGADPLLDLHGFTPIRYLPDLNISNSLRNTPLEFAQGKVRQNNSVSANQIFSEFSLVFGSLPYFFRDISLRFFVDRGRQHLDYILSRHNMTVEQVLPMLKKPYPELLKALIQRVIDQNLDHVLKLILITNYTDEQLSCLTNKIFIRKIISYVTLSESFSPEDKTLLLEKLDKFNPSCDHLPGEEKSSSTAYKLLSGIFSATLNHILPINPRLSKGHCTLGILSAANLEISEPKPAVPLNAKAQPKFYRETPPNAQFTEVMKFDELRDAGELDEKKPTSRY